MPATEDGTKRLLDFFVYGMLRAAESLGNAPLFMRAVVEQGLRKFMLVNLPTFRESDNATEACDAFTQAANASGLFDGSDSVFRGDADTVHADIGGAEMLRIRLDADFDWQLNRFGRPCQITLTRSRWRKN